MWLTDDSGQRSHRPSARHMTEDAAGSSLDSSSEDSIEVGMMALLVRLLSCRLRVFRGGTVAFTKVKKSARLGPIATFSKLVLSLP